MCHKNKDIHLNSRSEVMKIWNFHFVAILLSTDFIKISPIILLMSFVTFLKMARIQSRVTYCIWFPSFLCLFNNEQFLSIYFSFMTLKLTLYFMTFLKTTGQFFCRISLNLGLSDVSSHFDSGYTILSGILLV